MSISKKASYILFSGKILSRLTVLEYTCVLHTGEESHASPSPAYPTSGTDRTNPFAYIYVYWKPVPTSAVRRLSRKAIGRDRAGGRGGEREGGGRRRREIRGSKKHHPCCYPRCARYIFNCVTRDSIVANVFRVAHDITSDRQRCGRDAVPINVRVAFRSSFNPGSLINPHPRPREPATLRA